MIPPQQAHTSWPSLCVSLCVCVCVLGWGAGCICVEKGTEDVGHPLPGQKEAAMCWKPGPSFMFPAQVTAGRMRS